jgi:hypothetical protein
MSTTPTPIHPSRRPEHLQRTAAVIAALLIAAILSTVLVDRVFFPATNPPGTGSGVATTQTRSLPPFGDVDLAGTSNVIVRVGPRQSVIVHADSNLVSRITTQVHSGSLVIGTTPGTLNARSPTFVQVNVPSLKAITLHGSGNITVSGINSPSIVAAIPGSGTITAGGTTTQLNVTISGTGTAFLDRLNARDVTASTSGSGSIMLTATRSLTATVTGTGTILYSGNPRHLTTSDSGTGTVRPR